jgi:hypothetical protein
MGDALGEVPYITIVELFGLVFAILVDGRDKNASLVYKGPFGLGSWDVLARTLPSRNKKHVTHNPMPVKFSDGSFFQVLLRTGNIVTLRQVLNNLLSDPTALENSRLGVGEAPFQVGDNAIVGRLLPEVVRILQVKLMVGTTWVRGQRLGIGNTIEAI